MKIKIQAQNPLEWFALKSNRVPVPLGHTQILFVLSRAVLCAYEFDLFEYFKDSSLTPDELAVKSKLNRRALGSLMNVLTSAGYFTYSARTKKFSLAQWARKWCLKDSEDNLRNQQLFSLVCWDWMTSMDDFIKTGNGLNYHQTFEDGQWERYQKGMQSAVGSSVEEFMRKIPALQSPRRMMDIGGSHGAYSVALCKKYETLSSVILDLPQAIKYAAPMLAKYGLGNRVVHRKGNALTDEFGNDEFDLILISSLIHHFTEDQCKLLFSKVYPALKPGGYCVVQEFLQPQTTSNMEMTGAVLDLFFNLSSGGGNWSADQIKNFQTASGLKFIETKKFIIAPGYAQVIARKA